MPVFSVVIPVYNRARSISSTLESVRNQSFTDFECLVVDDGSEDGEELRARVESLGDARFHHIVQKNSGASAARNTGIENATGAFIAFLDSDDWWLSDKLQRDCALLGSNNIVCFSQVIMEKQGKAHSVRPRRGPTPTEKFSEYLSCHQGWTPVSTLVVPAGLAQAVTFDEKTRFGDDTDFALRLAAAGAQFMMHPEPLALVNDSADEGRLSQEADWAAVLEWLNRIRPLMTPKAYRAYRGWHVSRLASASGHYRLALSFYFRALVRGAFPPRLAAKAFFQIVLPRLVYRRTQSLLARLLRPTIAD